MTTNKTTRPTPILLEEAPVATLTRLIQNRPSTSVFGGWGPQMSRSANVLRDRN